MNISALLKSAVFCTAAVSALISMPASAQDAYPEQPISLIVPFPAGGGVDLVGRMVGDQVSRAAGKSIVVENRGGAGGTIGVGYLARSAPKGYVLGMGSPGNISIAPSLYPALSYTPTKDLQPVALAVKVPMLLITRPDAPFKDVASLMAYGRENPGKLSYGSGGAGTSQHLAGAMFAQLAKIDALHVPYKGTSPAMTDLMAGRTDFMFTDSSAMAAVKGGKVSLIAVGSGKRSELLPDTPTVAESGLPQYEALNWYGFFLPAGAPEGVTTWLNTHITQALSEPALVQKLNAQMLEVPAPMSAAEFTEFVKQDTEKWSKLVKSMNITLE